jgi:hypothetical protein
MIASIYQINAVTLSISEWTLDKGAVMKKFLLICCFLAAGCQTAALQPSTDFDTSVDFSKFQTFTWIDPNPLIRASTQRPLSPLVQTRLMTATQSALTQRGLRFVQNPDDADLAVAFTIGSRQGIRINSFPSSSFHHSPASRRGNPWGRGYWGTTSVQARSYTEGQLAIDLFDIAAAQPVWHGTVSRRVTQRERAEPDAALQEAVIAIFNKFPPN